MKIGLLTDTHWGVRGSSDIFRDYFKWWYETEFFPTLKERGITEIIHAGDFCDNRIALNLKDIEAIQHHFVPLLEQYDMRMHLALGNHDVAYRNTNKINCGSIFENCKNVIVYEDAVNVLNDSVCLVPWINKENEEATLKHMASTKAKICIGHFEIRGLRMNKQVINENGLEQKVFDNFDLTLSGHFHHKNSVGKIHYVGNPFHLNWGDFGEERGFHILDTETQELEFIENETCLFDLIEYDEELDYSNIVDDMKEIAYLRVLVENKTSETKFSKFLALLKEVKANVDIIDHTKIAIDQREVKVENIEMTDPLEFCTKYLKEAGNETTPEMQILLQDLVSRANEKVALKKG